MRGATCSLAAAWAIRGHFNPRSPCGERHGADATATFDVMEFQSTLPMRGATATCVQKLASDAFQSTLPMRGATFRYVECFTVRVFQSTLPMRGATSWACRASSQLDFNPRSPCGERPNGIPHWMMPVTFQSTLPMRGATFGDAECFAVRVISIHAPHAGSDSARHILQALHAISIHAPHAGSDKAFRKF